MTTKLKDILGTICGGIAVVAAFAAVSVMDGSEHEMAVRMGGTIAFALFAGAWAVLKEKH